MPKLPTINLINTLTKRQMESEKAFTQKGNLQISLKKDTVRALPADIILVLDCSGSMGGRPMELLNSAIDTISTKLRDVDRLTIIAFGSDAKIIIEEYTREQIFKGIPELVTLGTTNYNRAFSKALELVQRSISTQKFNERTIHSKAKTLLFMSDGKPNYSKEWRSTISEFAQFGYSLHTLGVGDDVELDDLNMIAEISGGLYYNANSEDEMDTNLMSILKFSQNLAYSLPELKLDVFPGVQLNSLRLIAPPREIVTDVEPGTHTYVLPDIQTDAILELVYSITVNNPGQNGETQDLLEWQIGDSASETASVMWVDMRTSLLAPSSTRPVVLDKVYQGFDAVKHGNMQKADEITRTLVKMKENPLAVSGATIITEAKKTGHNRGDLLALLSKTTTKSDGTLK
jgi:uncharacterized protein YegL